MSARSALDTYHGAGAALWILGLVALAKMAMGTNVILNGRTVAISADGIPLDSFTPDGARAVLAFFALWGLGQVLFGSLALLCLAFGRSLVPLAFGVLLAEQLGRKAILLVQPVPRVGSPPGGLVNLVFLGLLVAGLMLSLWHRVPAPGRP